MSIISMGTIVTVRIDSVGTSVNEVNMKTAVHILYDGTLT